MSGQGGGRITAGIGPNAARVVAVAAFVIAVLMLFTIISATRDTYQLRAVFDDVRGLIPGGDVTAGSVVVGTVKQVSLNEDGDPEADLEISGDFKVYEGAFANIRLASNVGAVNRVIDLSEGDPTRPELPDGAVLSGKQTDNPVDFDLAVSTLKPKVRDQIKAMLIGLDGALVERGPDFDKTLRYSSTALNETASLLAEVNADTNNLQTLVREGRTVVSALAESPQDLGEAAERTAALLAITGARQAELAQTSQLLGPALTQARLLLERTNTAIPNLRELVARGGPLLDVLEPFAELVPPAARAAGPFISESRKLVLETPAQLRAQAGLLRVAPGVVQKLIPTIDRLNPISDQLRVYTPETIGFFQNVADAASNFDANGHMIRVGSLLTPTLPPATQAGGEIGPSDCTPGLLAPPYHRNPGVNECTPWDDWRDSLGIGG